MIADFVAALEPINQLADRAPGFVWRLQTEDGDATAIRPFEDDMVLVNMSVWESLEALGVFVYSGEHREVMRRRRQWFDKLAEAYLVLWWVPAGVVPTVVDAKNRLETLRRRGPSLEAFTFRSPFSSPDETVGHQDSPDDWFCRT
jgi:heme-degrading monooxygenase HmoA